ncbi:MAG: glycosyltransferase family 4 protein [Gemmatimonadetes bacterium]|nr:glycosyltransferase family 4 protein [Gemmatimonadota bacterium]
MAKRAVRVTAVAASAQLGGTERVLLDFAARAFEHDINLRVVTPRGGPLIRILNELGIPAEVVPASERMLAGSQRAGHLWTLPGSAAGLITWARRLGRHPCFQDADAIYTVAFKTHLAVAWLRRHPVVWHLHEYPPAATTMLWRALRRFVPDAMIANSEATAKAWGSTTVIPNGVDLDRFRPRPRSYWIHEQLGIPREHRIIGMPAVFARWKGQPEVIKAFSVIRSQFSDVHLVIVGGSIYDTVAEREYGVELRASIEGEGQAARGRGEPTGERFPFPVSRFPQVHLLPFQPKIELVYPEFDLALHYSLRPEPFGRVILEAMASGVPVIAAGEGGPVEILGKGEGGMGKGSKDVQRATYNVQRISDLGPRTSDLAAGWLAPPRDVPALAQTLREALSLPASELRAMGQAARRRAEDHFSARQFARRVADVLRGAVLEAP